MLATILKSPMATATTIAIIDTFTKLRKLARTIDKVNEDAKEHGIYPDKNTEDKIQTAMNEVFADNLPLKMRKLTFGVNLGILKFSLETTRESKESGHTKRRFLFRDRLFVCPDSFDLYGWHTLKGQKLE